MQLAGIRLEDGTYIELGTNGSYWTSSGTDRPESAWSYVFSNTQGGFVARFGYYKTFGRSCRCIKDN